MDHNSNPNLCPIPWMSQSVRANGDLRICCQAQHGPTGGILKNDKGEVYNAKDSNLDEVRNSDLSKQIRKYMMEGKWHSECIRCEKESNAGMWSRNKYENKIWAEDRTKESKHIPLFDWNYALKYTQKDGTIDTEKIDCNFYDVRFGNKCNLKCRMCGPTDSSSWYDDQVKLWSPTYKDSHGTVTLIKTDKGYTPDEDVYNWHESDSYWHQMDNNIKNIKKLYIVGGEPLLINKHYEFLQKCVDLDCAKNITIEYNSNITNIPKKAWNIWKYFGRVAIGASIDGVGDINYYMRYPSQFNIIYKNLKRLSRAEGNFKIWIAATVNVFNILHFPEYMEWILLNKLPRVNDDEIRPILSPHPLHGPKFYNVKILPKFAKDHVANKFDIYEKKLINIIKNSNFTVKRKESSILEVPKLLNQFKNYMYAEDLSEEYLPKFWHVTRKLDRIRNVSIEKYIPELYNLLKGTE